MNECRFDDVDPSTAGDCSPDTEVDPDATNPCFSRFVEAILLRESVTEGFALTTDWTDVVS